MVIEQWQWQILFKLIFKKLCTVNLCPDYRENIFFGVLGLSRRQGVLYYSGQLISAFVGSGGEVHGVGGFSPSIVIFPQLNFCPSLSLNSLDLVNCVWLGRFLRIAIVQIIAAHFCKTSSYWKRQISTHFAPPPWGSTGVPSGDFGKCKTIWTPVFPLENLAHLGEVHRRGSYGVWVWNGVGVWVTVSGFQTF